ncbi:MAG TPA: O-antigen ligase family protein [Bryobacteraceae bacterium]|nr:O-antigen ligase family protein [Bryobacteraceae bacterium]
MSETSGRVPGGPALTTLLLGAYVLLLPVQVEYRVEMRIAPSDLILGVYLLVAAPAIRIVRNAWNGWLLAFALVLLFGAWVTVARSGVLPVYVAANKLAGFGVVLASYLAITSAADSWTRIRWFMRMYVLGCTVNAVAALAIYAYTWRTGTQVGWWNYGKWRVSGLLIDPNAYGGLLVLALAFLLLARFGDQNLFGPVMTAISCTTLFCGVLFSFSRTAWAMLAMVAICTLLLRGKALIAVGLAVAACGLAIFMGQGTELLDVARSMALRPAAGTHRLELVSEAWETFSQHPFTGGGLGCFFAFGKTMIHNSALMCLAELGIVGFTAFCGMVWWWWWQAWRLCWLGPAQARGLNIALLSAHTAMLMLSVGIEALYQRHWWMTLALIGAARALWLRATPPTIAERPVSRTGGELHAWQTVNTSYRG